MEPLKNPENDRVVKQLRAPPHRPLSKNLIWPPNSKSFFFFVKYKFYRILLL